MDEILVTVAVFTHPEFFKAELIKSRLQAAGITCLVTGAEASSYADKVTIRVHKADATLAMELVNELESRPAKPRRDATITDTFVASVFIGSAIYWGTMFVLNLLGHNIDTWGIKAFLPLTILICFVGLRLKDILRAGRI